MKSRTMRARRGFATPLLWIACFLAAVALPASAQLYEVIDLGTLGGSASVANGISENGLVAGWAQDPFAEKHAVLWDLDGIVDLGKPAPTLVGEAVAVNDQGQVAGFGEGSPQFYQGYLWESGSWTPIGVLPGDAESLAWAIDANGRIAGESWIAGPAPEGEHRAVIWEAGALTDLGTLGGSSRALGINDVGQAVGVSLAELPGGEQQLRGFVWEAGEMMPLDPLPGDVASEAKAVDDVGNVVGSSWYYTTQFFAAKQATLWRSGSRDGIDLGYVPAPPYSCTRLPRWDKSIARAVNNLGEIVGDAMCITSGASKAAFLWRDGTMFNLNELIPADAGWNLLGARGINDAGQIVGLGVRLDSPEVLRAFLLEPPIACAGDLDCDDGVFCNGAERCVDGWCREGSDPCPGQGCDEGTASCVPLSCDDDGTCELFEDCYSCPSDCVGGGSAFCGDGICQPSRGEDCLSCASDCRGRPYRMPHRRYCCGADVDCTDARCNSDPWICADGPPVAYCCGDGICSADEGPCSCSVDCGEPPPTEVQCSDGIDNDCDGLTDGPDPDCACGEKGDACLSDNYCCSGVCKKNGSCR